MLSGGHPTQRKDIVWVLWTIKSSKFEQFQMFNYTWSPLRPNGRLLHVRHLKRSQRTPKTCCVQQMLWRVTGPTMASKAGYRSALSVPLLIFTSSSFRIVFCWINVAQVHLANFTWSHDPFLQEFCQKNRYEIPTYDKPLNTDGGWKTQWVHSWH